MHCAPGCGRTDAPFTSKKDRKVGEKLYRAVKQTIGIPHVVPTGLAWRINNDADVDVRVAKGAINPSKLIDTHGRMGSFHNYLDNSLRMVALYENKVSGRRQIMLFDEPPADNAHFIDVQKALDLKPVRECSLVTQKYSKVKDRFMTVVTTQSQGASPSPARRLGIHKPLAWSSHSYWYCPLRTPRQGERRDASQEEDREAQGRLTAGTGERHPGEKKGGVEQLGVKAADAAV